MTRCQQAAIRSLTIASRTFAGGPWGNREVLPTGEEAYLIPPGIPIPKP